MPSDVFSRYHRLRGNNVLMVSGTDDHGTPITTEADREGTTPAEIVKRYHAVIVDDLKHLGLAYDLFTQTSTENHRRIVQEIKLGSEPERRPDRSSADLTLKREFEVLFDQLSHVRDGLVDIEVRHGLPFRLVIERRYKEMA